MRYFWCLFRGEVIRMRWLTIYLVLCVAAWGEELAAVSVLKRFSDVATADTQRLLVGDIPSARGGLMDFRNGISAQLCFAVVATPEETARRLQDWDPSRHEELKVYAFHILHNPCSPEDFAALKLNLKQRPMKWLLDKTQATTERKSDLNLTRREARELGGATSFGDGWAKLLLERAAAFQRSGIAAAAPYEFGNESVLPAGQLRAVLAEQPRIVQEFEPILKGSGLVGKNASLTPVEYWSLFEADHHATLNLGAAYRLTVGDHYQLLDLEYYVSGDYYTSASLYEIWPVRAGNTTVSLVWRGDFFAAPVLSFTKGTERIAYGVLMIQEIKKEIRCFQADMKKGQ